MLAGPYATMLLADLGADVTKIEPPGGDISRQVGDSLLRQPQPGQAQRLPGPGLAGRPAAARRARRRSARAAGQPQAVGDPPARAQLRRAAAVERADRLRRAHRLRPGRRRRPGLRLPGPGGHRRRRAHRRPGRAADPARLLLGGQLGRPDRGPRPARPDRLRTRRPGRRVDARGDAVPAQLPRRGLAQRRDRAAAAAERGALLLRPSPAVPDGPRATWPCSSPTTASGSPSPPRRASAASPPWPNAPPAARRSWPP